MSATILKATKNAQKAPFDGEGCIDTLEKALVAAHARFLTREGHSKMLDELECELWRQAQALVDAINDAVGSDLLYLADYAGAWVLYGRPDEESVDKRLLWGFRSVDNMARLVARLEKGMEVSV